MIKIFSKYLLDYYISFLCHNCNIISVPNYPIYWFFVSINLLNAVCSWIGNRQTSTRLWVIKCLFQNTEFFCHLLIKSRDDRTTHLPCCCRYNDRGKLLFLRHHNQHSNSWLNFPCCIIPYKIVYIDGCRRT